VLAVRFPARRRRQRRLKTSEFPSLFLPDSSGEYDKRTRCNHLAITPACSAPSSLGLLVWFSLGFFGSASDLVPLAPVRRSGKTTLLNRILAGDHGKRIVVIENEFGEIDIDSELVAFQENGEEDIMLINNGCICCSVRGDLVDMLGRLVIEKKGQFDHILIETTGLANPAPIIQTFYLEPDLLDTLRLDGVVTLVDSKHAMLHLDEEKPEGMVNEALEQIAFADRLVMNKADLVTQPELLSIENRVRTINNIANVQRAEKANVDLNFVLGVGGFDLDRVEDVIIGEEKRRTTATPTPTPTATAIAITSTTTR